MGKAASVFGASRGVQRLEKDNEAMQGFLIGRGPKIRKNTQGKKQKITEIEQLEHCLELYGKY